MSQAKQEFLARSKEFWNPGKTQDWIDMGVDLVMAARHELEMINMIYCHVVASEGHCQRKNNYLPKRKFGI